MIIRYEKPSDIETITDLTKVAFKQLSFIEKDAIADVIIDYEIAGVMADQSNKAFESIIKKNLTEMSDGKFMLRPSVLSEYDS